MCRLLKNIYRHFKPSFFSSCLLYPCVDTWSSILQTLASVFVCRLIKFMCQYLIIHSSTLASVFMCRLLKFMCRHLYSKFKSLSIVFMCRFSMPYVDTSRLEYSSIFSLANWASNTLRFKIFKRSSLWGIYDLLKTSIQWSSSRISSIQFVLTSSLLIQLQSFLVTSKSFPEYFKESS